MTMEDRWLNNLLSPESRKPLRYNAKKLVLETEDHTENFAVISGVPQLLPNAPKEIPSTSEAHQKLGSKFQYREHYEKDAEVFDYFMHYEDGASRHEAQRLHETIAAAIPRSVKNILDVGCGNAWVAGHFTPKKVEVYSLDISSKNPRKALQKYPSSYHYALVADVYALPFSTDSFDCIIASEIIEHVADPRLFIEKLLEVLRPSGKLIITTPFEEKITYSLCIHCNRPTPQHAHLHSFSKDSLAQLVRRESVQQLRLQTFSNKALTKLQTHVFLQHLPHRCWRWVDKLANIVVNKPARLMMSLKKESSQA